MELEGNETPTYKILGCDTPERASTIKQEMEKIGVDVIIISKPEDLYEYSNVTVMDKNNVVMVFKVPVNFNTIEMFQHMSKCLQTTS